MSERHTQSSPNSGRSSPPSTPDWTALVNGPLALPIGGIVGLLIGLFLAWQVWPVQWTNAYPSDLSPEVRAHYLAAVADAYAYYQDDRATEIASVRLFDLNNNLGDEIAAAQAYFNDNSQLESRTFITNLSLLAQALDAESPDLIAALPPQTGATEDSSATDATTDTNTDTAAPAVVAPGVLDWLNWVFVVIAAAALIGGGVYILSQRSKRRQEDDTEIIFAESDDEEIGGFEDDGMDDEDDDGVIYRRPLSTGSTASMGSAPPEGDVYFDDGDFEPDYEADDEPEEAPSRFSRPPARASRDYDAEPPAKDRAFQDSAFSDTDFDDPAFDDASFDEPARDRPVKPGGPAKRPRGSESAPLGAVTAVGGTASKSPVSRSKSANTPANKAAFSDTLLGEYIVEYRTGIHDYDEPHDIVDEATGAIIGECGMGVNMKNGYLQNNPDHVIALDVYLFDKKDDTRILSQNRILLCDYVRTHKLEHAFSKERPNDPEPLLVTPDATFQLVGNSMVMDCEILDVEFAGEGDAKGIFQQLKLRLTVRDKG